MGFEGVISSTDKVCETSYRAHLTLLKNEEDSDNEDLDAWLTDSKIPYPFSQIVQVLMTYLPGN